MNDTVIMADISSTDPHGEISITDMKHLVTAVISFSSDQITTAFLNVDQLRLSLLKQIEKTQVGLVCLSVVLQLFKNQYLYRCGAENMGLCATSLFSQRLSIKTLCCHEIAQVIRPRVYWLTSHQDYFYHTSFCVKSNLYC